MLGIVVALQLAASPAPPPDRVALLKLWVDAVEAHRPGELDAAAERIHALDQASIETICRNLPALVKTIADPRATIFYARLPPRGNSPVGNLVFTSGELDRLRSVAAEARARGDANRLLKRAAVLHTDLAILGRAAGVPSRALRRRELQRTTVLVEDGRQVAMLDAVNHWAVARLILFETRSRPDRNPDPQNDKGVLLWYQATTSYLINRHSIELPQFDAAVGLFPGEADLLMAAGAIRDMLAAPGVHATLRRARAGFGPVLDIGSQASELNTAESYFRRALEADRGHAEARIRLAGVLGRQGQHAKAAAELQRALPQTTEPLLRYYGLMFLGRALSEVGDVPGARSAYERAATVSPEAQAPAVALSQLLLRTGDPQGARQRVAPTLSPAAADHLDAVWTYYLSAGREADLLLKRMYAAFVQP